MHVFVLADNVDQDAVSVVLMKPTNPKQLLLVQGFHDDVPANLWTPIIGYKNDGETHLQVRVYG